MTSLLSAEPRAPRFRLVPDRVRSEGALAVELAEAAGLVLDPWQRVALDSMLGVRADGKWAAYEAALIVSRQNGKGAVIEARELAGLFLFGERLIIHSAHLFPTALEAFRRVLFLIENTPDLDAMVKRVSRSHGEEGIELVNGNRLLFKARSSGGGRGFSGDLLVLDEAYDLDEGQMAALLPVLSTRPNPQVLYTSSAPPMGKDAPVLRALMRRGRAGASARLAYTEYCMADGADPADREAWADANPSLGVAGHGISAEFLASQLDALGPDAFSIEHGGVADLAPGGLSVIDAEVWAGCRDRGSVRVGPASFGVEVSLDQAFAAVAAVGRAADGRPRLAVAEHRRGAEWVAGWCRANGVTRVAADVSGPVSSLLTAFATAGIDVVPLGTRDAVQACGSLLGDLRSRAVVHDGAGALEAAVPDARKRDVGDGGWVFGRKASGADISPLQAATWALWLHATQAPLEEVGIYVI